LRSVGRYEGIKIPTGSTAKISQRMRNGSVPAEFIQQVDTLMAAIDARTEQIGECDRRIEELVEGSERAQILLTTPGVGNLTAAAYCSIIGGPGRFRKGRQVQSYLGLVPREHSSG